MPVSRLLLAVHAWLIGYLKRETGTTFALRCSTMSRSRRRAGRSLPSSPRATYDEPNKRPFARTLENCLQLDQCDLRRDVGGRWPGTSEGRFAQTQSSLFGRSANFGFRNATQVPQAAASTAPDRGEMAAVRCDCGEMQCLDRSAVVADHGEGLASTSRRRHHEPAV